MKRWNQLLTVLLAALCLTLTACGGAEGTATTIQLKRAQGDVWVYDKEDESVTVAGNLGLYSGYQVETADGLAWIELDSARLTKLGGSSRVQIHKEDKRLALEVEYGELFFDITEPLQEDETLSIRASDMMVGIRGTCGWVSVPNPERMLVYLLEGTVECTAAAETLTLHAGEMAVLTVRDGAGLIEPHSFTREEIPAFVSNELRGELNEGLDALLAGSPLPGSGASDGNPASDAPGDTVAAGGLEPPLMLMQLRESAVSYDNIPVIRIGGGGAPDMLDPSEAKGFINGIVMDLTGDGADELIAVSTDSMMSTMVTIYDQTGEKAGSAEGSFYGSGEYGGGDSTLDVMLFQNPNDESWCVAFCNYIESNTLNTLDASLYAIGENGSLGYIDRWSWNDIMDEGHAELPGLQSELEAAGWTWLNTDFLSFGDRMECMLLSRAEVIDEGNEKYLHIYSPEDAAGAE